MSFYWSHAIALQELSHERSYYKFRSILTLTEVYKHLKVAHARNFRNKILILITSVRVKIQLNL